jgi:Beta-propeller repeat
VSGVRQRFLDHERGGLSMKRNGTLRAACAALVAALGIALAAPIATAADPEWTLQIGSRKYDYANGVATDASGNVYVVGTTSGRLYGPANKGESDAWVMKFDPAGNALWKRQPGTNDFDKALAVATDAAGDVFVVGQTKDSLGGVNKGEHDAWVVKFDADGRSLWKRQPGSSVLDGAVGATTDSDGNLYVVGATEGSLGGSNKGRSDAWIIKFDADGHYLWKRQPGTTGEDSANSVATDLFGNVYVVGVTGSSLGGAKKGYYDAWIIKFDADGHYLWKRQPGTIGEDYANSVATDVDGNVYVVGYTSGALGGTSKGIYDAWVAKLDADGHWLWKRQPATNSIDAAMGVATDADGGVYITGYTGGALGGPNIGQVDAWLVRLDAGGHFLSKHQFGTTSADVATAVAVHKDGDAYVVGYTRGSLGDTNVGGIDAWIAKFAPDGTP